MTSDSSPHDTEEAVLARIRVQRLRWLSALNRRQAAALVDAPAGDFPRSRTMKYVLAHPKTIVLGIAGMLLLRRGWYGKLGMLLLQRIAARRFAGR